MEMELGDKIRNVRHELGYSQNVLARKLGYTSSTMVQYEKGISTPKLETLRQLSEISGKSISYFVPNVIEFKQSEEARKKQRKKYNLSPRTPIEKLKCLLVCQDKRPHMAFLYRDKERANEHLKILKEDQDYNLNGFLVELFVDFPQYELLCNDYAEQIIKNLRKLGISDSNITKIMDIDMQSLKAKY